jgi:hypothetical protein
MATYKGNDGTVTVGGNVVAEIVSFSINENADRIEDTVLGDTNRTYKAGLASVGGTITCRFDHTDSTGQEAMTVGSEVALVFYPVENASTFPEWSVTAAITQIQSSTALEEIVERVFSWEAAGALTKGVVA